MKQNDQKLSLDELKVQSFITHLSEESGVTNNIVGGDCTWEKKTHHCHTGDCHTGKTYWACIQQ
jgi:hypothetical protein